MKVYTKTGDKGTTSLVGGKRVSKCHPRVMAYGDIDELISWLGLLRASLPGHDAELRRVQQALMNASAHIAAEDSAKRLPDFPKEDTLWLEGEIDRMTAELPPLTAFVLPAGPREVSECHVARTICRRCERAAVAVGDTDPQVEAAVTYINRLSDYLFTLARYVSKEAAAPEDFWLP